MRRVVAIALLVVPIAICSCNRHKEYPGFTWVSKGQFGHQYIDVKSIPTGEYIPLRFRALLENRKEKSYSIVSIETDCQRLFIDDGGTAYRVDGTMAGEVPPDEASGDIDKKGMRAIVTMACANSALRNGPRNTSRQPNSTEIGHGFEGDWDDAKAMAAYYGNYDLSNQASILRFSSAVAATIGNEFPGDSELRVRILAVKELGDGSGEKKMLFTQGRPADQDYDGFGGRDSAPLLGVAVFAPKKGGWVVEASEKYLAAMGEGFGTGLDPSYLLPVYVGPSKAGFVVRKPWSDMRDDSSGVTGSFVVEVQGRLVSALDISLADNCSSANNQESPEVAICLTQVAATSGALGRQPTPTYWAYLNEADSYLIHIYARNR